MGGWLSGVKDCLQQTKNFGALFLALSALSICPSVPALGILKKKKKKKKASDPIIALVFLKKNGLLPWPFHLSKKKRKEVWGGEEGEPMPLTDRIFCNECIFIPTKQHWDIFALASWS